MDQFKREYVEESPEKDEVQSMSYLIRSHPRTISLPSILTHQILSHYLLILKFVLR